MECNRRDCCIHCGLRFALDISCLRTGDVIVSVPVRVYGLLCLHRRWTSDWNTTEFTVYRIFSSDITKDLNEVRFGTSRPAEFLTSYRQHLQNYGVNICNPYQAWKINYYKGKEVYVREWFHELTDSNCKYYAKTIFIFPIIFSVRIIVLATHVDVDTCMFWVN